eukprot:5101096-Amphidinium_carterae.1
MKRTSKAFMKLNCATPKRVRNAQGCIQTSVINSVTVMHFCTQLNLFWLYGPNIRMTLATTTADYVWFMSQLKERGYMHYATSQKDSNYVTFRHMDSMKNASRDVEDIWPNDRFHTSNMQQAVLR